MSQRKAWTAQEDNILRLIVQQQSGQRWGSVAKIMEQQYKILGRTGKQCRQRWHNQLDPSIKADPWSLAEQQQLFGLHNQFGNKWARIAQSLPGRTDNSIKNYFYCSLRKSVRRINKLLTESTRKWPIRQLSQQLLSKIMEVSEDRFERKLQVTEEQIDKSIDIKNRLLEFSHAESLTEEVAAKLETFMEKLEDFSKCYKRKRGRRKKIEKNVVSQDQSFDQEIVRKIKRKRPSSQPELKDSPQESISSRLQSRKSKRQSDHSKQEEQELLIGDEQDGIGQVSDISPPHVIEQPQSTNFSNTRWQQPNNFSNKQLTESIMDLVRRDEEYSYDRVLH